MRRIIISMIALGLGIQLASAQTAGRPGAFARMGFGARGMGMGNAMTGVVIGDISGYYNPAVPAFAGVRHADATVTFLSLDRSLNFLGYTQQLPPTGGVSAGLINAGVGEIDGRDRDGEKTETYSTYENLLFLSFSNRLAEQFSVGVTMKLYHSKLFEQVTTTTVGFDAGALFRVNDRFSIGLAFQDIGSKYKWNTKDVYSDGRETEDKFPAVRRLGVSYASGDDMGIISVEAEHSPGGSVILRGGIEYAAMEFFTVRGGIDRIDFGDEATGVRPAFGFTLRNDAGGWTPALTYAYAHESFAPRGYHIITLSAIF